jgi:hypothetical protein
LKKKPENIFFSFSRTNNRKPLILIDLYGLLDFFTQFNPKTRTANRYQAELEDLCGGRSLKCQTNCDAIFEILNEFADIVFFFDGSVSADKLENFMRKKHRKYRDSMKVVEMINNRVPMKTIKGKFRRIPTSISHKKIVEEKAEKHGKLIKAMTKEADAEIVKYANENNAFAIIAEDSDFLIFEGSWRYFSIQDLRFNTMTSTEFDKKGLWTALGLQNSQQMAMLASMAGNDLVDHESLKIFHSNLLEKFGLENSVQNKFRAISNFIIKELEGKKLEEAVDIIANEINDRSVEKYKTLVKKCLEMYKWVSSFFIN